MAGKKLSILTELTLNAAGFDKGVDGAKEKFKALRQGGETAASSIKGVFANIGDMFAPMTSQLGGLGSGVMDGVRSFQAMVPAIKTVKAAFIATGIGAIVIGLATAFSGLVSWIKRTDEGGDSMRKVFDVIKAVINTILDKLASLGSAIVKLFKGDFKGAGEDAKKAFTGWGDAISDNIDKAKKLNDIQDKLEDFNETKLLNEEKIRERISELSLKARDEENFSAEQRLAFTKQLEQAYNSLHNLRKQGFNLELAALKQEQSTNANNQEIRQKINDKIAEGLRLNAEHNDSLKETTKLNNKLFDQVKELKAIQADRNIQKSNPLSQLASIQPKKLEGKKVDNGLVTELTGRQLDEYKKTVFDFQAYNEMLANSFVSLGESLRNAVGQLGEALGQGANSFKEYATNLKGAVKQIIGNLIGEAVAHMIASQIKFWAKLGPIGLVAAPAAAAAGAGIVKTAFNSLVPKFAMGGIVPGYSFSGDRVPALVNSGEMILNRRQQANLFEMINKGVNNNDPIDYVFRLRGRDLIAAIEYENKIQRRGR